MELQLRGSARLYLLICKMHPRSLGLHFGSSASTCLTGGSRDSLRSVPRVEATRELSLQKFDVHGEVVNREPRGGWLEHGICSRPFCSRSRRCLCGRVCGSARTCLCFLFPFYRTECSERSCYCMCLMSHMEAVRLQECFGNIMPGTDNLAALPPYYRIAFAAILTWSYLRPFSEKLVFPHHSLHSPWGRKALGSAVWGSLRLGNALQSPFCCQAACKGFVAWNNSASLIGKVQVLQYY